MGAPLQSIHLHIYLDGGLWLVLPLHPPYRTWEKQGFIEATPGKAIDKRFIAKRLAKMQDAHAGLGWPDRAGRSIGIVRKG